MLVNVLPLVTDWEEESEPVASSRLLLVSSNAQCVAVPVAVTLPSVIAETVTFLPVGLRSPTLPTVGDVFAPSA